MIAKEIRVGIIGANANGGWAKSSHVPAVKGLPGLRLAAVATRKQESAREAAKTFGANRWYSDPFDMMLDDEVDIVTISVTVPWHRELVLTALDAGKAIYCEAPLGRNVTETEEMARAVHSHHTAVGLQGRFNPAVRRAADLVASGAIGRPIDAKIVSQTAAFGPEMSVEYDLYNKLSFGADLVTVGGAHTLDIAETVLGPITEVIAGSEIRWPVVTMIETGEQSERETPDRLWVAGKTQSGAALTAHVEGGVLPEDVRSSFEVRGSDGWLRLTSNHPYGFQAGDLTLSSNVPFVKPDRLALPGGTVPSAINVGEMYAQLANDLREGTYRTPGFDHALHNARLMHTIRDSAEQRTSRIVLA